MTSNERAEEVAKIVKAAIKRRMLGLEWRPHFRLCMAVVIAADLAEIEDTIENSAAVLERRN